MHRIGCAMTGEAGLAANVGESERARAGGGKSQRQAENGRPPVSGSSQPPGPHLHPRTVKAQSAHLCVFASPSAHSSCSWHTWRLT